MKVNGKGKANRCKMGHKWYGHVAVSSSSVFLFMTIHVLFFFFFSFLLFCFFFLFLGIPLKIDSKVNKKKQKVVKDNCSDIALKLLCRRRKEKCGKPGCRKRFNRRGFEPGGRALSTNFFKTWKHQLYSKDFIQIQKKKKVPSRGIPRGED